MAQREPVKRRPVAVVVLAAGLSRRMGQAKLLLPCGGQTMLGRTLAQISAAAVGPVAVVVGAYAAQTAAEAQRHGLPCYLNEDYAAGQSGSLRVGLQAVPPGHGVMFALADQPFVRAESYRRLAEAYATGDAPLVAPLSPQGRRGNPVIIAPQLFAEIAALSGDAGARLLLQKHRQQLLLLPLDDAGLYLDIDTPQAYAKYCVDKGADHESMD